MTERVLPDDPLAFIIRCLYSRKVLWTYHINMRMSQRYISREEILSSVNSIEIIEEYPEDKYLPSYLLYARIGAKIFHILITVDVSEDNIRIVTAYEPDFKEWNATLKQRRRS